MVQRNFLLTSSIGHAGKPPNFPCILPITYDNRPNNEPEETYFYKKINAAPKSQGQRYAAG
jgi:hypothetical protein